MNDSLKRHSQFLSLIFTLKCLSKASVIRINDIYLLFNWFLHLFINQFLWWSWLIYTFVTFHGKTYINAFPLND